MWQLATAFAEIALRRRGPESLPDSAFLLLLVLAADVAVSLVSETIVGGLTSLDLVLLSSNILLSLAFTFAALTFFKLERRFRQTASALLGTDVFITLVYLPFAAGARLSGIDLSDVDALGESPFLWIWLVFFFWSIYVYAFVLARSLSQPLLVGIMFAILYLLTWLGIVDLFIVDTDPAGQGAG